MPVSVRRIDAAEAIGSASIIVQAYAPPPWEETWSSANAVARLQELTTTPGYIAFAAMDDDVPIGFVFAIPHTTANGSGLHISEIAVLPQYQRKGVGSSLLSHVEREAQRMGHGQIWLVSRRFGGIAEYYGANGYSKSEMLSVYVKQWLGATQQRI